ncbi:MAG: hypothetical protein ABSC61_08920 [Anaerolineales bacterium]
MNPPERPDPRLLEMLSAYLDGRLEGAGKAALEERLNKEESLRRHLAELRSVRDSLRTLPLLKPPRSLALTHALAGKTAGKPAVFSPRRMAFGSALASLAFVCVLSVDVVSRVGFLGAASAPRAVAPANEAFSAPRQSSDTSGAGKSAATAAPASLPATETPSPGATPGISIGCDNCTPTGTPAELQSPSPGLGGGCGDCAPTEEHALNPPQVASLPFVATPQPRALPDFQTVAPYLEVLFALAAVLMAAAAALAAVFVRRRH